MQSHDIGSGDPLRGDPWPPEMSVTVEDDDSGLIELLWVRDAWGIRASGDLPPALTDTPEPQGNPDPEWAEAWSTAWTARLEFVALEPDPLAFQRLQLTSDGSPERAEALRPLLGPLWEDRPTALRPGGAFQQWQARHLQQLAARNSVPLCDTPERMTQVSLIPAWEAGLRRVISIPCHGEYTRILSPTTLLVTDTTRADPRQYAEAQEQFREAHGKPRPGWSARPGA